MEEVEYRPDPDALLDLIKKEESKAEEGKLTIFFGMCAGVGKTYTMLQTAREDRANKLDVVIGIIETHKRAETEELVEGFEIIPRKEINYRGTTFHEMDIDAIIERRPGIVLVDELAHTNIPGSRHLKRYQDVLELLRNGIHVYTTLNVQHVESRAETVKQITGISIRETVPDLIIERADEIELIDITPGELLERLKEGKVYTPERSRQSIENFFRKGNLTALREMALRITAERVDKDLHNYRAEKSIDSVWKSSQKLLVAVGPGPYSMGLIRWTRRLAYSMEVPWIAAYIETVKDAKPEYRESLLKNIELARSLGAEIQSVHDTDVANGLLRIARANNVTQILIGKTRKSIFGGFSLGNQFLLRLLRLSSDIDIYIIGGDREPEKLRPRDLMFLSLQKFRHYALTAAIVFVLSVVLFPLAHFMGYQAIGFIFMLGILLLPLFDLGPGPMLLAAGLSALSWDYFFIPPFFTFRITRTEDILMFVMYFMVAAISGYLSSHIRATKKLLAQRERSTTLLYRLSRDLSSATEMNSVIEASVKHLDRIFHANTAVLLFESFEKLRPHPHNASTLVVHDDGWNVAQWVFLHGEHAGKFTDTLPSSDATYYPIKSKSGILGVLALQLKDSEKPLQFKNQVLLDSFFSQINTAIEREYLKELAEKQSVVMETDKLYKTLFDSISHELKTPITTIQGVVEAFENPAILQDAGRSGEFVAEIKIAANRLKLLVENMLNMARLESGSIEMNFTQHSIMDIIDAAIRHLEPELGGREVIVDSPEDDIFLLCDFSLLRQVIINILRNANEYSPEGCPIEITVSSVDHVLLIKITDHGHGIPADALQHLFQKFYRVPGTKAGGTGLGLSIVKGFVELHKGSITAGNSAQGGAEFTIVLPLK
ncbi:MAG: sensor histidine kinase KdpD [Ignavibacteria bacterium]|nr:sensor histidine kinase KdpD [Ignavibacteria bacterium]